MIITIILVIYIYINIYVIKIIVIIVIIIYINNISIVLVIMIIWLVVFVCVMLYFKFVFSWFHQLKQKVSWPVERWHPCQHCHLKLLLKLVIWSDDDGRAWLKLAMSANIHFYANKINCATESYAKHLH